MTTKARILDCALTLFATLGYEAVSIRDIAKQVGIKESSIYNHFLNKKAIFDGILEYCQAHILEHYGMMNLDQTLQGDFSVYQHIPLNTLTMIALEQFKFYVADSVMLRYRRMLTIEQFNNEMIAQHYRDLFMIQPIQFQQQLFKFLGDSHALVADDPQSMAYDFYAPIFLLMNQYDEMTEEAEQLLTKHINHFVSKYTIPLSTTDN
jgi:AcrR family transcriptional regulator